MIFFTVSFSRFTPSRPKWSEKRKTSRKLHSAGGGADKLGGLSHGFNRILTFSALPGYALHLWKHMISRDFHRILTGF